MTHGCILEQRSIGLIGIGIKDVETSENEWITPDSSSTHGNDDWLCRLPPSRIARGDDKGVSQTFFTIAERERIRIMKADLLGR
jgi:hypothetical protein